jgi:hypothetical protein
MGHEGKAVLPADRRGAEASKGDEAKEEHTGIDQYNSDIPRAWAEGFAQLDPNRPRGDVSPKRWRQYVDDCARFLDDGWAGKAAAFGWGQHDLFGCSREPPFPRIDHAGLLWFLNGNRLLALSETTATIETRVGARWMVRRCSEGPDHLLLPWEPAS